MSVTEPAPFSEEPIAKLWLDADNIIHRAPTADELSGLGETQRSAAQEQTLGRATLVAAEVVSLLPTSRDAAETGFNYGNEEKRLEDLKATPYDSFRQYILDLNSNVVNKVIDVGESDDGFTKAARLAVRKNGSFHVYPDHDDVEEVLYYAYKTAQAAEGVQDAALILSGGLVAVHPFTDGNGRVSRGVYAEVAGGFQAQDKKYAAYVTSNSKVERSVEGRRLVDMSTKVLENSKPLRHMHRLEMARRSGVTSFSAAMIGLSSEQDSEGLFGVLPEHVKTTVPDKEAHWIEDSYANALGISFDHHVRSTDAANDASLRFALGYAQKYMPVEFASFIPETKNVVTGERTLELGDLLTSASANLLCLIADGAREYARFYAIGYIDLLKDGDKPLIDENGRNMNMSVRSAIVDGSNNLLTSKINQ